MKKNKEKTFLDKQLIHEFMELVNNNEIFFHKPELVSLFNLICTFKDRMGTAVNYLNSHEERPTTEEDFIAFIVYACMIYDGFNKMHENLLHQIPIYKGKRKYFKDAKQFKEFYFDDDTCPTDDVFFEYLRAMAFAHPYEVDKRKDRLFMQDGEKHYCPWVVVNNFMSFDDIEDSVGIRIYTSANQEDMFSLTFSFNNLKEYIKSVYNTFPVLIEWATNIINGQNEEWKLIKVNRKQDDIKVLKEIKTILDSRFANAYTIERAISYLTCKTTNPLNNGNVQIFRDKIIEYIPKVCDCVDNLNYEDMEDTLSFISSTPKNMHQMAYYQLEKIYSYLNKRSKIIDTTSNEFWGLQQAYDFSQKFAKKWVVIDVRTMEYDEIKLLVAVACYLEKQEQLKEK